MSASTAGRPAGGPFGDGPPGTTPAGMLGDGPPGTTPAGMLGDGPPGTTPAGLARLWPDPVAGPLPPADLVAGYPRHDRPTLRMNFVTSIDGAVSLAEKSAGLSGPADKQVFAVLRMVCDALVVAAGTVRAEGYHALRLDEDRRAWRAAHGLAPYPLLVVVSGSLDLDPTQGVFADAPVRPLVVTHAAAPADRRAALTEVAEVITLGAAAVDLAAMVAHLHARGATQLLSEGGPHLFGALTAAGLVDEVCLTVSPLLAGAGAGRITAGPPGPPRAMALRQVLSGDGALLLRYARTP